MNLSKKDIELIDNAIVSRYKTCSDNDKEYESIRKRIKKSRITIASAKQKGMNLQHWVAEKIAFIFNVTFKQSDDQSLVAARPGGQHGVDIILRGDLYKKFPFDIECKSSENLNIVNTIEQAKANTKPGRDFLIVHKKKALNQPIVIMEWDAFERLIRIRCKCAEKTNNKNDSTDICSLSTKSSD